MRHGFHIKMLPLLAAMLCMVYGCYSEAENLTLQADGDENSVITIMHTNDRMRYFLQHDENFYNCGTGLTYLTECFGGAARMYTKIQEIRKETDHNLLLHSGPLHLYSFFSINKNFGIGDIIKIMNKLKYTSMLFTMFDFPCCSEDTKPTRLKNFNFPAISSIFTTNEYENLHGLVETYQLVGLGKNRIGIIGLNKIGCPPDSTSCDKFGFDYDTMITRTNKVIQQLKNQYKIDKIIALTDFDLDKSTELAEQIEGIDVVFCGNGFNLYQNIEELDASEHMKVVNSPSGEPVIIANAGCCGTYLGRLDVKFDENGVLSEWSGERILLDSSIEQDPEVLKEVIRMYNEN